jgi:hypothetical protein
MTRLNKALETLVYQIAAGREYPDIVGRIAAKYNVREESLARAYDDWDGEMPEVPYDTPSLDAPHWHNR